MIAKLDEAFSFHAAALDLRAARQQVLAANIANADTPGFKARDMDFRATLAQAVAGGARGELVRTAAAHLRGAGAGGAATHSLLYRTPVQASIDGNTVEMDAERARFAENALHYEANLRVISMQIRNLLAAVQG